MNPTELVMRQRQVRAFIDADPISVSFVRTTRVKTPAGGWVESPLPPLSPQRVRLIIAKRRYGNENVNTEAGEVPKSPYNLLGLPGLDIKPRDVFTWNGHEFKVNTIEVDDTERVLASLEHLGPGEVL